MLTFITLFFIFEGAMLLACCIYVSPMIGATSTKPAPVMVAPQLPKAVAIPAAWRKRRPK